MAHAAMCAIYWLAPRSEREALLGDLAEEYALRASEASRSAGRQWLLRQICASVPPLLWARITRWAWITTLGVALLAYVAVGIVELIVSRMMATAPDATQAAYNPLGMGLTFPLVVLIGYVAAGCSKRAPRVLAAMMVLSVTAMTLWADERLPTWYRIAYFLVGPAATFIGSGIRSFHARRA